MNWSWTVFFVYMSWVNCKLDRFKTWLNWDQQSYRTSYKVGSVRSGPRFLGLDLKALVSIHPCNDYKVRVVVVDIDMVYNATTNFTTKDQSKLVYKLVWTRNKLVLNGSSPVHPTYGMVMDWLRLWLVHQFLVKKPDWTRLLNTKSRCRGGHSGRPP